MITQQEAHSLSMKHKKEKDALESLLKDIECNIKATCMMGGFSFEMDFNPRNLRLEEELQSLGYGVKWVDEMSGDIDCGVFTGYKISW
jgi:hypothetical protein